MAERADMIRGEWDEDGFHLHVATDDDSHDIRVTDVETARDLIGTADQLREWVAEHDRQKAAYDVASGDERRAVLGAEPEPCGHDGWQAGCPQCEENARDAGDWLRKAERESR